jgi:hypothetical protein
MRVLLFFWSMTSHFLVPCFGQSCVFVDIIILVPSPQNTLILKHQFMSNDRKVDAAFNIIIG